MTERSAQERSQQPLRVLLLEDSAFDAELLQESLSAAYPRARLQVVRNGTDYVAALQQGGFEVILSDHELGGFSGTEALLLARERAPQAPFIFVSGVIGEDNAVELLKQGATDYVSKGRLSRLPSVLDRAMREVAERAARITAQAELRQAKEEADRLTEELAQRVREVEAGEARLRTATDAGGAGRLAARSARPVPLRVAALQAEFRAGPGSAVHLPGIARCRASGRPGAHARGRRTHHRDG